MRRWRSSGLLAATCTATLALLGCGGVGGSPSNDAAGRLTTMGFGTPDEVATARVRAFTDAYPKITLKINKGGFDPQQFLSAVSSGNPPDIVYLDRQLIGTYVAKGALQPLDSCVGSKDIALSDYRPQAVQDVRLRGHLYGIPEFYDTRIVLADNAVLGRAGLSVRDLATADWQDLTRNAKKISVVSDGKVSRIGFDPKLPEFLPLWAAANGGELVTAGGKPRLDDPKVVEALSYAVGLINDQGGWSAFKAFRDTWDVYGKNNEFVRDQAGAFPWEGWYLNTLVQSGSADAFTGAPFLARNGKPVSFETGSAWAIPKGAKNPQAACEFAKTMTETSTWLKAAAARQATDVRTHQPFTGLYTANKVADEQIRARYVHATGKPGLDAAIGAYYTAMDYAVSTPASPAGSEIKDAWTAAVNRVLSGQQSPAAALARAQRDAMTAYRSAGD